MLRVPIVDGLSYEKGKDALERQLHQCFVSPFGPGDLPVSQQNGIVQAAILPHGPYPHAGPCAAWGFKELAEAEQPGCYLILSVAHKEPLTCTTDSNFMTPLGIAENDDSLRGILVSLGVPKNDNLHNAEFGIEVQLPFLQYLLKSRINARFVPLLIGNDDPAELAKLLQRAIETYGKRVCIIVSSDFTHFGNRYQYTPFRFNVQDEMYRMDAQAINAITVMDTEGFLSYCDSIKSTICGKQAIAVLLEYLELAGKPCEFKLLRYYTSADLTGDYERGSVGYASVVVR